MAVRAYRPEDGSLIPGYYGIEIDGTTPASPPGTTVIAAIPNFFPGETADMTYYTSAAGAEVFDAGTINFGGAAGNASVARMLANLWAQMSSTRPLPQKTPRDEAASPADHGHRRRALSCARPTRRNPHWEGQAPEAPRRGLAVFVQFG